MKERIIIKKLLFIHHYGGYGGAGISLLNNIEMLKDNYEITVLLPSIPDDMINELKKMRVDYIINNDIGMVPIYSGGSNIFKPSFYKNILKIKKTKIDIEKELMFNQYYALIVNSLTLSWIGIIDNNIPKVCFVRETLNNKAFFFNFLYRFILNKKFQKVFFISKYDLNKFNLKKNRSLVLNDCSFNSNLAQKKNKNKAEINILFLGGYNKIKGLHILLKSLERIKNKDISLTIAGDCKIRNLYGYKLQNKIQKLAKKFEINIIGKTTDTNFLFENADIVVFPSTTPHQARPLFEAGFYKLPVIISDFTQTNERVIDKYNGLTFKPNSSLELRKRIILLIENEQLRIKLGENNFNYCIEEHECENLRIVLNNEIEDLINVNK